MLAKKGKLIVCPGVYDGFTARIALREEGRGVLVYGICIVFFFFSFFLLWVLELLIMNDIPFLNVYLFYCSFLFSSLSFLEELHAFFLFWPPLLVVILLVFRRWGFDVWTLGPHAPFNKAVTGLAKEGDNERERVCVCLCGKQSPVSVKLEKTKTNNAP
jgi:hypothetical protein